MRGVDNFVFHKSRGKYTERIDRRADLGDKRSARFVSLFLSVKATNRAGRFRRIFGAAFQTDAKNLRSAARRKLYILLSVVCGYPMGAKLSAEFYEKGALDGTQCLKLATFCSTGGPIFILGTVGGVYLKSAAAGVIILVSHIAGALLNGLLYRRRFVSSSSGNNLIAPAKSNGEILGDCMQNAIMGVLTVGGFVTIFICGRKCFCLCPFSAMRTAWFKGLSADCSR